MIARKDEHIVRVVLIHKFTVLIDGVGRAGVPAAVAAGHVGRQHEHAAVEPVKVPVLSGTQIGIEGEGPVLRQNAHSINVRIDTIGKGEIDNPVLAAKGDSRLGHVGGQYAKTAALPAGQQHRYNLLFHGLILSCM